MGKVPWEKYPAEFEIEHTVKCTEVQSRGSQVASSFLAVVLVRETHIPHRFGRDNWYLVLAPCSVCL